MSNNHIKDKLNNLFDSSQIALNTSIDIDSICDSWRGRGIVIPAGGIDILSNAYLNIRYIKDFLGSKLPIEIWYLGEKEYFKPIIDDLRARYKDIKFINALDVLEKFPFKNISGWPLKSYCIFHSAFEEIIYLDSDCFIQVKPENIFDYSIYKEHKVLFCSDIEVENPKRIPYVNSKLGTWLPTEKNWDYSKTNPIWDILGIDEQLGTEIESGLIVVNKTKHAKSLLIARFLNEHNDVIYNYIYGDKDTYRLAFNKTNTEYNVISEVSRTNNIITGSIDYNIIYAHRVLNSKFNIQKVWDALPNNLIMNNSNIYEVFFKELQKIISKYKFSLCQYNKCNSLDTKAVEYINYFIAHQEIKSILDIGCGDGSFTKEMNIPNDTFYHGIDILSLNINKCKNLFKDINNYYFSCIDACEYNDYKSYDLILVKDVFTSLPFQDIHVITDKCDLAKYCIIINDTPHENRDIARAEYRKIDMNNIYSKYSIDSFTYESFNNHLRQCITYHNE